MKRLKKTLTLLVAVATSCALVFSLCACGAKSDNSADDGDATSDEETAESFIAHGTEYGKTESVNVSTDLKGNFKSIAVEETIANPDEKATIKDKSSLNAISFDEDDLQGVSYKQNGQNLTWTTNKRDITYTGTTDKELPFSISYSYSLNGKKIAPSKLKNVKGKLKITITYTNNADATITVDGEEQQVKLPYLFASLVTLDPEHARNIEVQQGTCITMNGQQIAVGVAAPGLKDTLGLDADDLDIDLDLSGLSEDSSDNGGSFSLDKLNQVTITADVLGFDMPSITTMATDSMFGKLAGSTGNLIDKTDSLFDTLGTMVSAIGNIGAANSTVASALGKISTGESALGQKLPTLATGLSNMSKLAGGIKKQAQGAVTALGAGSTAIDNSLQTLNTLLEDETLTEDQRAQVQSAINNLTAAKGSATAATNVLTNQENGTTVLAGKLSSGLTNASTGITKLNKGVAAFATALGKMETALEKLAGGSSTMSETLNTKLGQIQNILAEKSDLIEALGDYVSDQGAYCGSAKGMSASTTFTITAQAQD